MNNFKLNLNNLNLKLKFYKILLLKTLARIVLYNTMWHVESARLTCSLIKWEMQEKEETLLSKTLSMMPSEIF